MKVIITGSEGFIGRALSLALQERGIEVIGIDRLKGIEAGEFFTSSDFTGVDCVYHLAAQTSVFNKNKTDIIRDNIEVFKTVCDACKRAAIKLVYASSSTAFPANTTSLYGISKRFNEEYARCYYPEATGVRFHNVYGPNPRQGSLLWYLLNQERVKLYNQGRNVRHFTYISDIVQSLIIAKDSPRGLVNAANPEETTILHFAELVGNYKPVDIELVNGVRDFDRKEQAVNNNLFTIPLQYTPVAEGIRKVFESMGQENIIN